MVLPDSMNRDGKPRARCSRSQVNSYHRLPGCLRHSPEGSIQLEEGRTTSTRFTGAPVPRWVLRIATALAILTAIAYFAIGLGMVPENFKSPPAPVMVVAGFAYLIGGGLILVANRALMLAGAVANALVLLLFVVSAFTGNATIDPLSLSGKTAQVVLGALLIWFVKRMGKGRDGPRV